MVSGEKYVLPMTDSPPQIVELIGHGSARLLLQVVHSHFQPADFRPGNPTHPT